MVKAADLRSAGRSPRGFEPHSCHFFDSIDKLVSVTIIEIEK